MSDQSGIDLDEDDELARSRAETRSAFENRALAYAYIYEELADELGEERADELMRRSIHRRGLEIGRKYRAAVHDRDLEEVGRIFCEDSPCGGELFEPAVEEEGEERIVLRMTACPLLDAWRGAGLDPEEMDHMCSMAATIDEGTFEAAGLELTFLDRLGRPGSERCLLELRLPAGR
jgi:predicted ArsR family transcriptional regulator